MSKLFTKFHTTVNDDVQKMIQNNAVYADVKEKYPWYTEDVFNRMREHYLKYKDQND